MLTIKMEATNSIALQRVTCRYCGKTWLQPLGSRRNIASMIRRKHRHRNYLLPGRFFGIRRFQHPRSECRRYCRYFAARSSKYLHICKISDHISYLCNKTTDYDGIAILSTYSSTDLEPFFLQPHVFPSVVDYFSE